VTTIARIKAKAVDLLPDPLVFRLVPLLYRRQEPELARLAEFVPPDRTAIDVGGWLGPWTRELARRVPSVTCIEPQPDLAAYLRKVVPANVTVVEAAVSDAAGTAKLSLPEARHGANALASLRGDLETAAVVHEVEVIRLDDLDVTDVGFVKIDVEGNERAVIDGATTLIRRDRPRLLLEAEQRHLDEPLGSLFERVTREGYEGWFLYHDRWHPLAEFDVERHQLDHLDDVTGPDYINNVLFCPVGDGPTPEQPAT
jgi:FkbM family methyltransferase